jgi:hypothetical protein
LTDALVRPDGAIVTAGAIDRALGPITDIAFYQANQPSPTEVLVDVVAERGADVAGAVRDRLTPLCSGLEVKVRTAAAIAAEPSGKFRVARRHFPLELGRLFEGCEGVTL